MTAGASRAAAFEAHAGKPPNVAGPETPPSANLTPSARTYRRIGTAACLVAIGCLAIPAVAVRAAGDDLPACPHGWTVEVVAAASRVLHPTAVACAPDGRVFVCEDYMDMPGPVDRPVNRILCVQRDGRVSVFADQVYVAFSMEYIDGKLYVHHCPRFSVFTDDGGDAARARTDLITTTNPAPWGSPVRGKNQINDHIPAGFQLAMDGFLYIAVGDKGVHGLVGRDGRRLELPLGGLIRMRPDGTGAEVYATGFRTVLNPAIDAQDEIFLYDNNDHLNIYKTAVGHIVDGGYYGYPWDAPSAAARLCAPDGRPNLRGRGADGRPGLPGRCTARKLPGQPVPLRLGPRNSFDSV